jgi:6-phosphogluconolactonase
MTDRISLSSDLDALAKAAAHYISQRLQAAVNSRGTATLVLAGGSTPKRLYEVLAENAPTDNTPWPQVTVLFGDERAVAADDPDSNYQMAKSALLDALPVAPKAVHRMMGELGSVAAAEQYEPLVPANLDVVLLGLGEDGHTASLFPGRPEVELKNQRVVPAYGPKPPPERISLSLPALNSANDVAFLVSGAGKAGMLAKVMAARTGDNTAYPAARVMPVSAEVVFFVDEAAAGDLEEA